MAARENQGLQIALIIFVMLTIVLIVTTFVFFNSYKEGQERIKQLEADNSTKDQAARTAVEESSRIKGLFDPKVENTEAVEEAAKQDFEKYGKGLAEADQNYRALVAHVNKELVTANNSITEITAQKKELADKLAAEEAATKKAIDEYTTTIAQVTQDMQARQKQFGEFEEQMNQDKGDLSSKFEETRKRFDELTQTSSSQITTLGGQLEKLQRLLEVMNDEKNRVTTANEVPDGKVNWVNQRSRSVWINVGSADGLRRQTAFSIYPDVTANPAEAESKGKIEVTHLMGPHMAEARIVEDDLSDPIMPGDRIFSPTWEPGRAEHFALVGLMDIDDDGSDDRQMIRNLIVANGGVIDEEIGLDGTRTGEMSVNTKFLIHGDQPKAEQDSPQLQGWSDIHGEADTLGVKQISVHAFLDYMGYEPQERTVGLGARSKSADFKPRLPEGVQRVLPSNLGPQDMRRPAPSRQDYE
ncbi:MAG: hypothetical protein WD845_07160 [Pirellulales bacterium]